MSKISPKGQTIFKNLIRIAFLIALLLSSQLFAEKPVESQLDANYTTLIQGNSIEAPKVPYIHKSRTLGVLNYDLYNEISKYDWDADLMYAIAVAESGGNPEAVNKGDKHRTCYGSFGVLQLGCVHIGKHIEEEDIFDPYKNIEAGYRIWKSQGYNAWGAYTNLSYLKFL